MLVGPHRPGGSGVRRRVGDTVVDDATARTFESFGYEWTTFSEVRDEDEEYAEQHYLRDLDTARLHGMVGLDAGCGRGRYTRFLSRSPRRRGGARRLRRRADARRATWPTCPMPSSCARTSGRRRSRTAPSASSPRSGCCTTWRTRGPASTGWSGCWRRAVMSLYLFSRPEGGGVRSGGVGGVRRDAPADTSDAAPGAQGALHPDRRGCCGPPSSSREGSETRCGSTPFRARPWPATATSRSAA